MNILFFAAIIAVSSAFDCTDRHCSLTMNDKNEVVFDCSVGRSSNISVVKCIYMAARNKIILTTVDSRYIPVDKIVTGAFSRLIEGLLVDKIFINKLQFKSLNKDDFDGLLNISHMLIENPQQMASDTFLYLATRTKYFLLTVSCVEGNSKNSFDNLFLLSDKWRLYTKNCNKQLSCEFSNCDHKTQSTMSKISSSDKLGDADYQIAFQSCKRSHSCINELFPTVLPVTTKGQVPPVLTPSPTTEDISLRPIVPEYKFNDHYDSTIYVVTALTTVNSIVIIGILAFLIIWWYKVSTSATNNKHTIILDAEDDNEYLK